MQLVKHAILVLVLLGATIFTINVSCRPTKCVNPVIGTWTGSYDDVEVTITLNPNGLCSVIDGGRMANGTWIQEGTSVTITIEEQETDLHGGLLTEREMLLTQYYSGEAIRLRKK